MDNQAPAQQPAQPVAPVQQSPVSTPPAAPPQVPPTPAPSKSKKIFIVAGSLFVLVLLSGGTYVMTQAGTQPTPTPVTPTVTVAPSPTPTVEPSPTTAVQGKKQSCPDEWIENQMGGMIRMDSTDSAESSQPPPPPGSYFIVDGKRVEMEEYDVEWVKKNCNLTPTKVY